MTEQEQSNGGLLLAGAGRRKPPGLPRSPGDPAGPHPRLAGAPCPPLLDPPGHMASLPARGRRPA